MKEIHNRITRKWSSNTSLSFTEAREQFALLVEKSEDWDHWKLNSNGHILKKNVLASSKDFTEQQLQELRKKHDQIEIGGTAHLTIIYKLEKTS